jgi:quercetin dioxygenase-like cupin family protein
LSDGPRRTGASRETAPTGPDVSDTDRKESAVFALDLASVPLQRNTTAGGPIRVAFPFHSATGTTSTAAVLFELDPGDELAMHTDSAEEVLLVLEGEAQGQIGERAVPLEAGRVAIIPAMTPHSVLNTGEDTLRVIGIFPAATVVSTFERPLEPDGPQVLVIGAPVPLATPLLDGAGV